MRTWVRRGGVGRAWLALSLPWRARGRVRRGARPGLGRRRARSRAARPGAGAGRPTVVADVHEDYAAPAARPVLGARGARAGPAPRGRGSGRCAAAPRRPDRRRRRRTSPREVARAALVAAQPAGPDDCSPTPAAALDRRRARCTSATCGAVAGLFAMLDAVEAAPAWHARPGRPDCRRRPRRGPGTPGRARPGGPVRLARPAAAARGLGARPRGVGRAAAARGHPGVPRRAAQQALRVPRVRPRGRDDGPAARPAALVADAGAGAVVQDAAGAAAVLRGWADDPAALVAVRASAHRRGRDLAADSTAAFVAAVVPLTAR